MSRQQKTVEDLQKWLAGGIANVYARPDMYDLDPMGIEVLVGLHFEFFAETFDLGGKWIKAEERYCKRQDIERLRVANHFQRHNPSEPAVMIRGRVLYAYAEIAREAGLITMLVRCGVQPETFNVLGE